MKFLPITTLPPPPTAQNPWRSPNYALERCSRKSAAHAYWLMETQEWMGVWTCGWMLAGVVGGGTCGGEDGWRMDGGMDVDERNRGCGFEL